jgi:hypothetical protein
MAESRMGREHLNKCGHEGCACMVEPSQSYCSEHCSRASSANTSAELPGHEHDLRCRCGHAECEEAR